MSKKENKIQKKVREEKASSLGIELLKKRCAGVLMHLSSLPSPYGIGDLGKNAYWFADWLEACGFRLWQTLPIVPNGVGNSPYASWSAFAGNALFIDLENLHELGFLEKEDLETPIFPETQVDYGCVIWYKNERLLKAAKAFLKMKKNPLLKDFEAFCQKEEWLHKAVIFKLIHTFHGERPWWEWEAPFLNREEKTLQNFEKEHEENILEEKVIQFFFDIQWKKFKKYCNDKNIAIVGDIPIYVAGDSSDVWYHKELFTLNEDGTPSLVSGVPPDAFTQLGQRWGTPLYRWDLMAKDGYSWWKKRLERSFEQSDIVRLDHFRGLSAYWEIPGEDPDARGGRWVEGPAQDFFTALKEHFGNVPMIAEDLGYLDEKVTKLRLDNELPGMLIMQFAFGDRVNHEYLPHSHERLSVVYPGTHDNETLVGWWQNCSENARLNVQEYFGLTHLDALSVSKQLIRASMSSVANIAIFSMQDLLGLDNSARMNNPSDGDGPNWMWRMKNGENGPYLTKRMQLWLEMYNRK